jgi:hypothetical protein
MSWGCLNLSIFTGDPLDKFGEVTDEGFNT